LERTRYITYSLPSLKLDNHSDDRTKKMSMPSFGMKWSRSSSCRASQALTVYWDPPS